MAACIGGHFLFRIRNLCHICRCLILHGRRVMFQDALLESAPALRRRNHWPMATAFTLELMVASVLVLLPLITTGIVQLKTNVTLPVPPRFTPIATNEPVRPSTGRADFAAPRQVVAFTNSNHRVIDPNPRNYSENTDPQANLPIGPSNGKDITDLLPPRGQPIAVEPPPPPKRVMISHSIEAMLVKKVIPEYPQIAKITGMQGDVKLHAIIARDGTIQSLSVVSSPFPPLT